MDQDSADFLNDFIDGLMLIALTMVAILIALAVMQPVVHG